MTSHHLHIQTLNMIVKLERKTPKVFFNVHPPFFCLVVFITLLIAQTLIQCESYTLYFLMTIIHGGVTGAQSIFTNFDPIQKWMYVGFCWGYVALPCFVFCAVGIFDEIHNINSDWIIFPAFTVIFLVPRMWLDADAHPSNMKLCH